MMAQVRLVWALAHKDLSLFLADRRGVFLCFAVPVVLASIFGAVFQRPGLSEAVRLPVFVVAEDASVFTRHVVAAMCASDKLLATPTDRATALRRLADDASGVAVVLADGGGARPRVQVLHHPGSMVEAQWAEGLATEVVMREAAAELLAPLAKLSPALSVQPSFAIERAAVTGTGAVCANTGIDSYSHSFCGMTLQYLLFWGMDSGLLLLRERRQGIWRRLRAAPVPLGALVAGKALATALVALAQILTTFAFGAAFFGVRVTASPAGFAVLVLSAALLSATTGLVVAALGGTEGRARSISVLAILMLSLLGGLWLPSFLLPRWAQQAALALPTTWAARGFEGVTWQGMGWSGAVRCAGMVLGFSAAFLAVALWGLARGERWIRQGGKG